MIRFLWSKHPEVLQFIRDRMAESMPNYVNYVVDEVRKEYGKKYPFKSGRSIVNVGSVGQPRDKDPRACYVILDEEGYRFFRVPYDVEATARKIRAVRELDDVLADRLSKGI